MVMIDTNTRDPERTWEDVQDLVQQALRERLRPLDWNIGFFIARDIIRKHRPDFWGVIRARTGGWEPITHLMNLPVAVVELEDRIQLRAGGPGLVPKIFTVDRRASGN